jgi:hypothetical protein
MNFIPGQDQPQDGENQDLSAALEQGETSFVTEEKKPQVNTSTLGLFGLIALCAGGTYFMYLRGGPQAASAAEVATADEVSAFLADGQKHVALMKEMLKDTDKVVQRFRQSSARTQVPLDRLSTNPFRMEAPKQAVAATDDSASSRRQQAEERAAAMESVKTLKLQSVLYGTRKAALVNNQLVQEGMEIEGFVIERINQGAVVVRTGVYRFELRMEK